MPPPARPWFSARLPWDRPENALAALVSARSRRAAGGRPLLDLTEANPTRVGLPDTGPGIRDALAASAGGAYSPSPLGQPDARAAVAAELGEAPERIVLTASSSESYALLFKVLADPGDAVLVPEPSYPLFEYLARLEGIEPVAYRLAYDGAWHIDFASVDAALARTGGRARALIVVNPNNPTGSFLKRDELAPLASRAAYHGLAVIADEVFASYPNGTSTGIAALAREESFTSRVLTFALGGLSKACGMPQLKLGWITVAGPPALAAGALARLELVADTYLSVGAPVQAAAPRLLALGRQARDAIAARVETNRAALARALGPDSPCTLLESEGGWSAILRVPATRTDEDWAATLLEQDNVLVHPGYFFDLTDGTFLVLSLLPEPDTFLEGVRRALRRIG